MSSEDSALMKTLTSKEINERWPHLLDSGPTIRLEISPSFEPPAECELRFRRSVDSANDIDFHLVAKEDFSEEFNGAPMSFPKSAGLEILTILLTCHFPPMVSMMIMGCDGTFFRLGVHLGWTEVTYRWWCEPPEEWEGLGRVVRLINENWGED